ncbi:PEP-CTERM sorting domain-containing protein [bacterium]|nr:PEP-CTERM sorting domain-containing protein [bacterium]
MVKALVKMRVRLLHLAVLTILLTAGMWTQQAIADPSLNLPSDPVYMEGLHPGPDSYWRTSLSGVVLQSGEYDVTEGEYLGWCVDVSHAMISGTVYYPVWLYSSYDSGMPSHFQDPDWDMVNYIINHKQGTLDDIQDAIWHFVDGNGGGTYSGTNPDVLAMIGDANANGEGFVPGPGEVIAVLCDAGDDVQNSFVELERPVPEASTLMLFGSGISSLLFLARKKRLIKF